MCTTENLPDMDRIYPLCLLGTLSPTGLRKSWWMRDCREMPIFRWSYSQHRRRTWRSFRGVDGIKSTRPASWLCRHAGIGRSDGSVRVYPRPYSHADRYLCGRFLSGRLYDKPHAAPPDMYPCKSVTPPLVGRWGLVALALSWVQTLWGYSSKLAGAGWYCTRG